MFVEVSAKYNQIWYRIEWSEYLGTWILRKGTRDWVLGAWGQPWWHTRSLLQSYWRSRSITIICLELYHWMFKARANNKEVMRTAFNQKIYNFSIYMYIRTENLNSLLNHMSRIYLQYSGLVWTYLRLYLWNCRLQQYRYQTKQLWNTRESVLLIYS